MIMALQIWKPAFERMENIEKRIAAYREADKKMDDLTLGENCTFSEWNDAYEARNLAERTLKSAITNFAKFLGWELALEYDYMERRIDLYWTMKRRVLRTAERLHHEDIFCHELKAIEE